jgi:hypothetical protein
MSLKKLIVNQLLSKFLIPNKSRVFIVMFTETSHGMYYYDSLSLLILFLRLCTIWMWEGFGNSRYLHLQCRRCILYLRNCGNSTHILTVRRPNRGTTSRIDHSEIPDSVMHCSSVKVSVFVNVWFVSQEP